MLSAYDVWLLQMNIYLHNMVFYQWNFLISVCDPVKLNVEKKTFGLLKYFWCFVKLWNGTLLRGWDWICKWKFMFLSSNEILTKLVAFVFQRARQIFLQENASLFKKRISTTLQSTEWLSDLLTKTSFVRFVPYFQSVHKRLDCGTWLAEVVQFDRASLYQRFFLSYRNCTTTHSFGKYSIKVEEMGNFLSCVNKWHLFKN